LREPKLCARGRFPDGRRAGIATRLQWVASAHEPAGDGAECPIKIASHTLGSLRVQPAPGHEFSPNEQVLLHEVAEVLALYLSAKGKYLVRKAREALRGTAAASFGETRGYQPASDKGAGLETLRAAAGDKSRS